MKTMRKLGCAVISGLATLALLLTLGATPAMADSITFDLTQSNLGSSYTGPFVQVTVDLTSPTTATITFAALTNGGYTYLLTHTNAADVNSNGTAVMSNFSFTNSLTGFSPGPLAGTGTNAQVDGFGRFSNTSDNTDSWSHSATEISFTLTLSSGTWASAADVLTGNANGFVAAAGIGACAAPCSINNGGFVATGFATGDGSQVPEPASIALFGSGLMALAGMIRRRIKALK